MISRVLFFGVLACAPVLGAAREDDFSRGPAWAKLLHFRSSAFGHRSEADGPGFFLSPRGRMDARAELDAFLLALKDDKGGDTSARCRFPARYTLVRRELEGVPEIPIDTCTGFLEFKRVLAAKSVTLIFSSYYLNNPSSTFGHLFLRVNKADTSLAGDRYELLDHGINFAADLTTDNALAYGMAGIFGFFQGTFTNVPYFYKVREYNDFESRDIFEYDLNLTPAEVELLVEHLWELGHTWFNYYYFDENCAYHILGALEAIAPAHGLVEKLGPYVIPSESLKAVVTEPGFTRAPRLRPSTRRVFHERVATLTSTDRAILAEYTVAHDDAVIPRAPAGDVAATAREARLLDSALDWLDYKHAKDLVPTPHESNPKPGIWKQALLIRRSSLGVRSAPLDIPMSSSEAPHLSHGSGKFLLESGYSDQAGAYTRFKLRPAHHDLLDPLPGMPNGAQIEMFTLRLAMEEKPGRLRLEGMDLYNILSLNPVDSFEFPYSWQSSISYGQIRDLDCRSCGAVRLMVGGGWTRKVGSEVLLFLMGRIEADASGSFAKYGLRLGVGPEAGVLWRFGDGWGALARPVYLYRFWSAHPRFWRVDTEVRKNFGRTWALSLSGSFERGENRGGLGASALF